MLWSSHSPERNRQIHMGPLPMPPTMHKRAGGGDTLPTQEASRTRRPPRPLAPTGFLFLGYRQTEGTDPTDAERCLDLVYERIIQTALRARAKNASEAAARDLACAGREEGAKLPLSSEQKNARGDGKEI